VLFNEPKLLKFSNAQLTGYTISRFSALQRAEIAEIGRDVQASQHSAAVSVLFNEPKLLKSPRFGRFWRVRGQVSVLFNEPKLLKSR